MEGFYNKVLHINLSRSFEEESLFSLWMSGLIRKFGIVHQFDSTQLNFRKGKT